MEKILTATALLVAWATAAQAHATLETKEAPIGESYKAVLRVGHGCDGEATLKVRVRIPDGMISAKPMPKAGWTLETVVGAYDQTYEYFDTTLSEGVREIVWSGELLDAHYDEFVFRGMLASSLEPGTMLYFPAVQECATKAERWIEIPAEGRTADDLESPAPGLMLLPTARPH